MPSRLHGNSDTMNIMAKTTYGTFLMVCHGKFRDLSGVSVGKCKKSFQKGKRQFGGPIRNQLEKVADQLENLTWILSNHDKRWVISCNGVG